MNTFAQSDDEIFAIAQHYGLPTNFVDFTHSVDVAAFFATHGFTTGDSHQGVIYCGQRSAIEQIAGCRVVKIEVDGLWRMRLQRGLFVNAPSIHIAQQLQEQLVKIYFPFSNIHEISTEVVYPSNEG